MKGRYSKRISTRKKPTIKYRKIDFSSSDIKKQVRKEGMQKPYVLYPLAVGIVGGLATLLLGATTTLLGVTIAGAAIGLVSWGYNATFGHKKNVNDYLEKMRTELSEQVKQSIYELEDRLNAARADSALDQLHRLQQKFTTFEDLLHEKLEETELTFGRYMGMTEQVYLASLDNLKRIADIIKGTSAIDERRVLKRLAQLNKKENLNKTEQDEVMALQERMELLRTQKEKIQVGLSKNEQAMTKIDKVMAAIAEMNTGGTDKQANMDIEDAMKELSVLAERAKDYNVN